MNSDSPAFVHELMADLRSYQTLCEELLGLASRENGALSGDSYDASEFTNCRKDLLPRLDKALTTLRNRRQDWQRQGLEHGSLSSEIKNLFQAVQDVIMKILLFDRDNQQGLLQRGLVPARHLPTVAARQPHVINAAYRRYHTS
jgi:hypothetical protein